MSDRLGQHDEEAGCEAFEATLGLMDGTLTGTERAKAEAHAAVCAVCGPMVQSWLPVGDALQHHFADAAEGAKPDLAGLADRVLAEITPARPEPRLGWFARFSKALHLSQPMTAMAAAAAFAVVVAVPFVQFGGNATVVGNPAGHHCDLDHDVHAEVPEVSDESGFHVHELSFGPAKGMIMTAGDELPVIWVSEHDGA